MRLDRAIVEDAAIGVGVADTPDGPADLRHPGCAAVIWRRQQTSALENAQFTYWGRHHHLGNHHRWA